MLAGAVLQFIDFLTEVSLLLLGHGTHLLHQTAENTVIVEKGFFVLVDTLGILDLFQLFPDVGFDLFDFFIQFVLICHHTPHFCVIFCTLCYSAHCAILHTVPCCSRVFTCACVCIAFSYCNYSEPHSQNADTQLPFCSLRLPRQINIAKAFYECKQSTKLRQYLMALNSCKLHNLM